MEGRLLEIYRSEKHDPYFNLAVEEFLCENYEIGNKILLYLWQNDNTVVIGRNQNAYEQCDMDYIKKHGIKVARRLSGGGAVYHDLGNLNYTIISNNELFPKEGYTKMIVDTINRFGVHAMASGRNDIVADGRKVSGTAYFSGSHASYQHGCIMVNTDQEKMYRALRIKQDKIISKNIRSVYSRTANLQDMCSEISVESLSAQLAGTFYETYGNHVIADIRSIYKDACYKKLAKKYSGEEWNLKENADSKTGVYGRLSFGDCSLVFTVEEGTIRKTRVYTDSLLVEPILQVERVLADIPYSKGSIIRALEEHQSDIDICGDLIGLIQEKMES